MNDLLSVLRDLRDQLDFGTRLAKMAADAGAAAGEYWTGFVVGTFNASGPAGAPFTHDPTVVRFAPMAQALADAALVPIAMWAFYRVMFGHGMFSQYTARIMLPRIVVVIGLVNFAMPLVQAAVDLDNALSSTVLLAAGHSFDFVQLVLGWSKDVFPGPLGPVVTFAQLIGFLLLGIAYVIRYALLVLLAILAPVAAVMLILPDTQHYAREWASLFVTTLLMQPLQLLILVIGLSMEAGETTILRHGFALAALWMCFKVPGALHSASTVGTHAHSIAKHQAMRVMHAAKLPL
jgi:TrbL/VirB6 plasmid conjugal transfer protein